MHAVGSAVTNVAEGDKVILHPLITCGLCRACRFGDDVHCENNAFPGISTDGGYAEYLKTSARSVVRIDDSLEPADVAALADAGLTAYHAVAKAARKLRAGDRCVMIGAGGLGHIGIQVMAALSPAEIVVVDRNPDAVKLAESIGAHHGVVADGGHVEQVLELTGGNGAEQVIDFVGEGGSTSEGIRMTRRAGDYHVVGYGEDIDVPTIDLDLDRDQHRRQPGRLLQRPGRAHGPGRAAEGHPAHGEVLPGRVPVRHRRPRRRPGPRPRHPRSVTGRPGPPEGSLMKRLVALGISIGVLAGLFTWFALSVTAIGGWTAPFVVWIGFAAWAVFYAAGGRRRGPDQDARLHSQRPGLGVADPVGGDPGQCRLGRHPRPVRRHRRVRHVRPGRRALLAFIPGAFVGAAAYFGNAGIFWATLVSLVVGALLAFASERLADVIEKALPGRRAGHAAPTTATV